MDKVLMSTGKDDWGTPQEIYDTLNKEFGFTLDACADESNYKHENYYTAAVDGLKMNWGGKSCFAIHHIARKQRKIRGRRLGSRNALRKAASMAQPLLC